MSNTTHFNISAESFSSVYSPQRRTTLGVTATQSADSLRTTTLAPPPQFPVPTSPTPELDSMFDDVVRMAKKSSNESDSEDESDDDIDGYGTGASLGNVSSAVCQPSAISLDTGLREPFGMVGDPPKLSLASMSLNPLSGAFTRTVSSPLFDLTGRPACSQQKTSPLVQQPNQTQSDENGMAEGQGGPDSPPLCSFVGSPRATLGGNGSPSILNGSRASLSLAGNGSLGMFSPPLVSQQESKLLPFSPLSPLVSSSLPSVVPPLRLSHGAPESSVLTRPTSQISAPFSLSSLVPPTSLMQQQQQQLQQPQETLPLSPHPEKEKAPTHFVDNAPVFVPKSRMGTSVSPESRVQAGNSDDAAGSNLPFDPQGQLEMSPAGGLGTIDPFSKKDMMFRTKVCSYFYHTGHCQKGEQCNFSHDIVPGMEVPPLPTATPSWPAGSSPSAMSPTISPSGMPLSPLHVMPSCAMPVGGNAGMMPPGNEASLLASAGSPLCQPSPPFSMGAPPPATAMMPGMATPAPPGVAVPPVFCNPPPLPPYPYMGFAPPVDVALCGSPQKGLHGKAGDLGPMGLPFAPPSMPVPHHPVLPPLFREGHVSEGRPLQLQPRPRVRRRVRRSEPRQRLPDARPRALRTRPQRARRTPAAPPSDSSSSSSSVDANNDSNNNGNDGDRPHGGQHPRRFQLLGHWERWQQRQHWQQRQQQSEHAEQWSPSGSPARGPPWRASDIGGRSECAQAGAVLGVRN